MKNIIITLTLIAFTLKANLFGQVIISQDFEGPLTGWVNQGTLTSVQNSITAYAGGGMLALSTGSALASPIFALPSGAKYVSFWLNSFNDAPFGYTFTADLLQNGTLVFVLGSWMSDVSSAINPWSQQVINIPSGFTGNDFSISFKVQSFTNPNLRFYLDEIYLSVGTSAVGVKENSELTSDIKIVKDFGNNIKIFAVANMYNNDLQITTLDGKVVYLKCGIDIIGSIPLDIDLSEIKSGLYLIKLSNQNGALIRKLIL